ncbi:MAG: Ger(x)C family spore germination protein [Clostridia bacterium]
MKKCILIILCLALCGCKDYKDIENLTIVTAVAIDFAEDEEYEINLEVTKFTNDKTEVSIIKANGVTFPEAIANAVKITGNDLFFSHVQAVIISQEVASSSIYPFLDFIYRNSDFRLNIPFLIAKDARASEILEANSLIDDIAGIQIKKIVDSNQLISEVPSIPIYEFIDDLATQGKCGMLPVMILNEDSNGVKTREISGLALFDTECIYAFLDEKQTKTLGVLQNKAETGNVINEYVENTKTFELIFAESEIKPKLYDGNLTFEIFVQMELVLIEEPSQNGSEIFVKLDEIQKEITEAVHMDFDELIHFQIKYAKADFLGLENMVYRKYNEFWQENNGDFCEIIANLDYSLKIDCEIVSTGLVISPITIN